MYFNTFFSKVCLPYFDKIKLTIRYTIYSRFFNEEED